MAITLQQLVSADSKLFAKSEFGPAHSNWPALSFSSSKIARDFQKICRRGKDFVIYVGTSNPADTPDPKHRQRLVSIADVEPRAVVQTKQIVSPDSWARAQKQYPGRWDVSLRLARAWDVVNFPHAHDFLPATYTKFRSPATRGHPIPVERSDYALLMTLQLNEVNLALTDRASQILNLNTDDEALKKELSRLSNLIQADIARALEARTGAHPLRTIKNLSDLFLTLKRQWESQKGNCALCGEPIPLQPQNKLLKMSRDRIDSVDKAYDPENLQLTHYGCNLAKSDATIIEWNEYREMLRQPKTQEVG